MHSPGLCGVSAPPRGRAQPRGRLSQSPGHPPRPTIRVPLAWVCGQRPGWGSLSHTLSPAALRCHRRYPAIRSPRQREGYKGVFQDQLAEYTELLGQVRATWHGLGAQEVRVARVSQQQEVRGSSGGHRVSCEQGWVAMSWQRWVGTGDEPRGGVAAVGSGGTGGAGRSGGAVGPAQAARSRHKLRPKPPGSCWEIDGHCPRAMPWERLSVRAGGAWAPPAPPPPSSSALPSLGQGCSAGQNPPPRAPGGLFLPPRVRPGWPTSGRSTGGRRG